MSDELNQETGSVETQTLTEEEQNYEGTPDELTGFKPGPAWFDRKKVMITICGIFAAVVVSGFIFNSVRTRAKQNQAENESGQAARAPVDFLQRELNRSLAEQSRRNEQGQALVEAPGETETVATTELPKAVPVTFENRASDIARGEETPQYAPPPQGDIGGGTTPVYTANFSALVPAVEGTVFTGTSRTQTYADQYPYAQGGAGIPAVPGYPQSAYPAALAQTQDSFAAQNNQTDKNAFYGSGTGGAAAGIFLGDDLVWIGTIIPAVLETSVNTDLPGNVIARVSQNVYDSRTGKKLLIPQGTMLVAKYNSSVSYAQKRIQIVWDLLIRPDGYQLELEGMNGVDTRGMSGLKAEYRENWFEYLKAAGIITMFSLANSKMTEEVAKYGSNDMAAGVAASNSEFVNQIGGNVVSRAMNIQPTLTLQNGERINVMLNKNLYLPPLDDYPVTQNYTLK